MRAAIENTGILINEYTKIWKGQFGYSEGHIEHFHYIRECFNIGERTAENMLYLLARCIKGSVRYGKNGNFNQSPDKRRHGTNPQNMAENIQAISSLLKNRTTFSTLDYRQVFEMAEPGDLIYMDPPYQGVSNKKDNRYFSGVSFDDFACSIEKLNHKGIDYVISYDGACGGKEYGAELPTSLNCAKFLLNAGLSTQATLLGKRNTTFESLYISKKLAKLFSNIPKRATLMEYA